MTKLKNWNEIEKLSLTDEQWKTVNKVGLPEEARILIAERIADFRLFRENFKNYPSPSITKRKLKTLHTAAEKLRKKLHELDDDIVSALIDHSDTLSLSRSYKLLGNTVDIVNNAAEWAERARKNLTEKDSGTDTQDIDRLVIQLDAICFRFTKEHIKRSNELLSYVIEVFKIADPEIGYGSIDEAMKTYISSLEKEPSKKV